MMTVMQKIEGTMTVWRDRAKELREQGGKQRAEKAELIEKMCRELERVMEKK